MFHLLRRSPDPEPSPRAPHARPYTGRFLWVVATILGAVLVIGLASFPMQAAASPSVGVGVASTSSNRPLLKVVPTFIDVLNPNPYCTNISKLPTICHVTLTERVDSTLPLHWFSRSDLPAKFKPSSGNLSPGQSVKVTITINLTRCNGSTNLDFVGPKNVANVTLFCD